ncbi:MAG: tail fiber protein [Bacteroidia bacterium]
MDGYIGEIRLFASNFAPKHWAFCDGTLLPISSNTALFSILGTMYGGDGRTTFALPDLRGRAAIAAGNAPGLSYYEQGELFGVAGNTLTASNLPAHTHASDVRLRANNQAATTVDPTNAINAFESGGLSYDSRDTDINVDMRADAIAVAGNQSGFAGGSSPIDNHQPSLGLNFIICLFGIYPSRS